MHSPASIHARRPLFLAVALLLFGSLIVSAEPTEIWWTGGGGEDNSWTNAANWNLDRIPIATDTVRLGYAGDDPENPVSPGAQTINFNAVGEFEISRLWFDNEGDRSVTLIDSRASSDNYLRITATDNDAVALNSTATADARIGLTISARRNLDLQSANAEFIFGLNSNWLTTISGDRMNFSRGTERPTVRVEDLASFQWRPGSAIDVILDIDPLASPTFSNEVINNSTLHYYFATDATTGSFWTTSGGGVEFHRLGTGDRVFTSSSFGGNRTNGWAEIIAGSEGQGHFTYRTTSFSLDSGYLITAADSTVEITQASNSASRVMRPADNAGVTGAGNLRLNMSSAGSVFAVARDMTYTGRTILEMGVMRMAWVNNDVTHTGSLPAATIVEISADATLRLFNTSQTIGGLIGYTDDLDVTTYGTVDFEGGSLRIHSTTPTSFAGTFTGTGALIKSGNDTFTIDGTYSNVANRLLRVEEGILAVTGALDVSLGTFELAGGRILAHSLLAQDIAWSVMLSGATVDQRLVETLSTVNITDSTLTLTLEDEFTPLIGSQYTLVYAADNIIGASAENMFGYADGDTLTVDGVDFTINWVLGSESIVLTVIPEPRLAAFGCAILALMTSLLVKRRRCA